MRSSGGKTCDINITNRLIIAVGKHVVAKNALSGAGIGVRIDEPAYVGIVITGLQIVETGLGVVELALIILTMVYISVASRNT